MEGARGCCSCSARSAGAGAAQGGAGEERGSGDYWRPWIPTRRESERGLRRNPSGPYSPYGMTEASRKLTQYTHPVRLFWPKSRCYDYLYQEAKALLKNFPVQATISFYEDSDSEDDDGLDQDSGIECDD